jgi:hypothetical protein
VLSSTQSLGFGNPSGVRGGRRVLWACFEALSPASDRLAALEAAFQSPPLHARLLFRKDE